MKLLSRAEEIILLTVLKLEGDAYGISIREFIKEATGNEWSFASIYEPLGKLSRKGYLKKLKGDPTPERGGRYKCLYEITPGGKEALRDMHRIHQHLWGDIELEVLF